MHWQQRGEGIVWLSVDHTRMHRAGVCSSVISYTKSFVSWSSSSEADTGGESLSWGMKESEGFVYPELLGCQGQEAGVSLWPTWDVTLSGGRPKGKTLRDLNAIRRVIETALGCQLGGGSKKVSFKCRWSDRCSKALLARFHPRIKRTLIRLQHKAELRSYHVFNQLNR